MPSKHRRAWRSLIRTSERLNARLVRALRLHHPEQTLHALLALHVFVIEGIASCGFDAETLEVFDLDLTAYASDSQGRS